MKKKKRIKESRPSNTRINFTSTKQSYLNLLLEWGAVRVGERAIAVWKGSVNVNRLCASGFPVVPVGVVLVRSHSVDFQRGPVAAVTDAAGDHRPILRLCLHWCKLLQEINAVLKHARLFGGGRPLRLKLVAKLPCIVLAFLWNKNKTKPTKNN